MQYLTLPRKVPAAFRAYSCPARQREREQDYDMRYCKTVKLKDGRECLLRSASGDDAQDVIDLYLLTHGQTDFLASYPDESSLTLEAEAAFLEAKLSSARGAEIAAFVGGKMAGLAGISPMGEKYKVSHRAELGISVDEAFWGLGIGRALMEACLECARKAGFVQLELQVVAENERALSLYRSFGFTEYGRDPKGFRSRFSGWQELVYMRLEPGDDH